MWIHGIEFILGSLNRDHFRHAVVVAPGLALIPLETVDSYNVDQLAAVHETLGHYAARPALMLAAIAGIVQRH